MALGEATTFGQRLAEAIRVANTTQSAVARKLDLLGARMPRLLGKGREPVRAPEPETIRKLADHLGVAYEWLAIGRGPMTPGAWAPSPHEAARIVARSSGIDDETISAATERFGNAALSAIEWVFAIVAEGGARPRRELPERATIRAAASAIRRSNIAADAEPSRRRARKA